MDFFVDNYAFKCIVQSDNLILMIKKINQFYRENIFEESIKMQLNI